MEFPIDSTITLYEGVDVDKFIQGQIALHEQRYAEGYKKQNLDYKMRAQIKKNEDGSTNVQLSIDLTKNH